MKGYLVAIEFNSCTNRFIFINQDMYDIIEQISMNTGFFGNGEVKSLTFRKFEIPSGKKALIRLGE